LASLTRPHCHLSRPLRQTGISRANNWRIVGHWCALLHKDGNHGSFYPRSDDFGDEGVPFISAKAVTEDGRIDNTQIEKLHEDKASKLKIGWIDKGDVLLAHNASVGKVALYDGRFNKALIGTSLTASTGAREIDSSFLAAALRSSKFQRELVKNMGQTTRNQVPITAQRDLRFSSSLCNGNSLARLGGERIEMHPPGFTDRTGRLFASLNTAPSGGIVTWTSVWSIPDGMAS
jgi:hypothetical protein